MASANPNPRRDPRYGRPNNPMGTGLIIAASVLVAAGIAIYESPQVRQFIEHSRRKIAVALHSLGDEIQPPRRSSSQSSNNAETAEQIRRKRMEEIVRRNQNELIRQAQEEGIAVDLDELARIGREGVEVEMMEYDRRSKNRDRGSSFDDLVGSDGMLRDNHPLINLVDEDNTARTATATENATAEGLRRRGQIFSADSRAQVLFDQEHATKETSAAPQASRESTATIEGEPLIDMNAEDPPLSLPQEVQTESIPSLSSSTQAQAQDGSQSFHSFASASVMSVSDDMEQSNPHVFSNSMEEEPEVMSTGTLTPTEDGFSTAASMVGSQADDVAVLSMTNDEDHDARSEAFSEGGFSELGDGDRIGARTPNSWTDVGSDDGSEYAQASNQGLPATHYHI
ncbi:uncharacterized protein BDZ99DRAFT_456929 [Mytilinidion resinicola]|uniref:Uncharacterized protein n=1 Tax=Mytilinidion resinicola TaxID=574789 RepID=A0A6A6Z7S5_9PEZI|nr:uncharacterized protein BDZ99DRAFT_456929 [Mytilinidion resinicola]KAF2817161.1 hypothetical protein BDZ99DRAFT_456929 [Mytilinidion resinicola]